MSRFIIGKGPTGFSVKFVYRDDYNLIDTYCESLKIYDMIWNYKAKRSIRTLKAMYAVYIEPLLEFGFVISMFESFITHLKNNSVSIDHDVTFFDYDFNYTPAKCKLKVNSKFTPRDYQEPIIKFVLEDNACRVLPLQTGRGKTLITLFSLVEMGIRSAIVLDSMFVDIWVKETAKLFHNSQTEVTVIRGKKSLVNAIDKGKRNRLKLGVLIITTNTLRDYLSEYQQIGYSTYGCEPKDLYKSLKVGIKVIDEAHTSLPFQFRHNILTNAPKSIYLSATLQSYDRFVTKMYEAVYPISNRYNDLALIKYINIYAIAYYTRCKSYEIQTTNDKGLYNHIVFEQWIMKDRTRLANYLNFIHKTVEYYFVKHYLPGQKLLVYTAGVEMCDAINKYLEENSTLDLSYTSYFGSDESEVLHSFDVVSTTPKKSGTGKDVANLVMVLCTVAIESMQANLQLVGRLRPIDKDKYPNVDASFYYLVCGSIPTHMKYHSSRLQLFKRYANKQVSLNSSFYI